MGIERQEHEDDVNERDAEIDKLRGTVARLRAQLSEWEEKEAIVCGEDMDFEETIHYLKTTRTAISDVPQACPVCNGDGSEARMFDVNCPAVWTHPMISQARHASNFAFHCKAFRAASIGSHTEPS